MADELDDIMRRLDASMDRVVDGMVGEKVRPTAVEAAVICPTHRIERLDLVEVPH